MYNGLGVLDHLHVYFSKGAEFQNSTQSSVQSILSYSSSISGSLSVGFIITLLAGGGGGGGDAGAEVGYCDIALFPGHSQFLWTGEPGDKANNCDVPHPGQPPFLAAGRELF